MISTDTRRDYYLPAIIAIAGCLCGLFSKIDLGFFDPWGFSDFGWQMYVYKLTADGNLPYRDFWAIWAPGPFYLNALVFKILGISIFSAKVNLAVFVAISVVTLYCIAEKMIPKPYAFAISLISLLWGNLTNSIPYSDWFSTCFGMLALLSFIKYLRSNNRKTLWLGATGIALGLTFSFKQPLGILSFAALAFATVLSVHIMETPTNRMRSDDAKRGEVSWYAVVLWSSAMLLVCCSFPMFAFLQVLKGGHALSLARFSIFFLPAIGISLFWLGLFLHAILLFKRETNASGLFFLLIKREIAFAIGFAVAVVPWFVYFSMIVGWKEFLRIISASHPALAEFKRSYASIGQIQMPWMSVRIAVLLVALCAICAFMVFLLTKSGSKRSLTVCSGLFLLFLAVIIRKLVPFFPWTAVVYCFPLFLTAFLLWELLSKGKHYSLSFIRSGEGFGTLALATFCAYNFLNLVAFPDRNHYQMIIFPWLAFAGWVFYRIYMRTLRALRNPVFCMKLRKSGILIAVATPFLVPYVGTPLFTLNQQFASNLKYCEDAFRSTGKVYRKTFGKMEDERGKIYVNSAFLEQVNEITRQIKKNTTKDDYLYGGPSTSAMFNFLLDRRFPAKHMSLLFDFVSKKEEEEIVADLKEKRPKYYIFDDFDPNAQVLREPSAMGKSLWWNTHTDLYEYLSTNYILDKKIGRFYLYKLRPKSETLSERGAN